MENKKPVKYGGNQNKDTFMPPETMGKIKGPSIWDFSIDELIEYKMTGQKPKRILDVDVIKSLAKIGVSIKNICGLFNVSQETFCNNPSFLNAHREGRAEIGSKNRAAIVEEAEKGSLQAMIYLDRYLGGDTEVQTVNMTVTARPLEEVPTENLIDVVLKDENHKD